LTLAAIETAHKLLHLSLISNVAKLTGIEAVSFIFAGDFDGKGQKGLPTSACSVGDGEGGKSLGPRSPILSVGVGLRAKRDVGKATLPA